MGRVQSLALRAWLEQLLSETPDLTPPPVPIRARAPELRCSPPHTHTGSVAEASAFYSSEHDLGEDIYDCVPCEDEGDDIYEDIIKVEVQQPMVRSLAEGTREDSRLLQPLPFGDGPFGSWERAGVGRLSLDLLQS